ncbi:hypothetical protein EIP86_010475 [Pleurotus ostreatoroseus]|nr:hypothetical protein EIP86_010475 [Pleurotus ostreatoroseus]
MDFTELYKHTASLVAFSPGAQFILTAIQDRLVVRRADSFQISRTWQFTVPSDSKQVDPKYPSQTQPAWITHAGWSCDSEYVLAASTKRGLVNVYKLRDEAWNASIEAGAEGLAKAEWAPDGRSILCFSEWGLRVTIWSLVTGSATHIQFPLHVDRGDLLGSFAPDPDRGFGVRSVTWHPSGAFLAVAGWDDKVYILESLTWGPVAVLELSSRLPVGTVIWREPTNWLETTQGRGFLSYERVQAPYSIAISRPDLSKPYPKSGVVQMAFNISGTLLLVRFESTPHVVHLFSFPSPGDSVKEGTTLVPQLRSVLIHTQSVVKATWNPVRKGSLALCCSGGGLYLWSDEWVGEGDDGDSDEVAECVGVPAREYFGSSGLATHPYRSTEEFETRDLKWSPDGKGLALLDRDVFCCAFEVEDDQLEIEA